MEKGKGVGDNLGDNLSIGEKNNSTGNKPTSSRLKKTTGGEPEGYADNDLGANRQHDGNHRPYSFASFLHEESSRRKFARGVGAWTMADMRMDYARALADIQADRALKDPMVISVPNSDGNGVTMHTIKILYRVNGGDFYEICDDLRFIVINNLFWK
ncbi:hypothetical protein Tco_1416811, partial [Tanacetum coccineum]